MLAGEYASLTPPASLDLLDTELRKAHAAAEAAEAWKLLRCACGPLETAAMREEIVSVLDERLLG